MVGAAGAGVDIGLEAARGGLGGDCEKDGCFCFDIEAVEGET